MHKRRWRMLGPLTAALVTTMFTGCASSAGKQTTAGEGLDQLGAVTVVAREEGSGTRTVFAESLGFTDSNTGRDQTIDQAEIADAYMKLNPNADVEVVETDSTNGLTGTMDGTYDLGMSSRDLKDYEKELLESVVIAKDEIQVIVNKDNPLSNIASANLKNIYTGQIQNWKDLKAGTTDK